MAGFVQLIGRIMLALIFILAGIGKLTDPAGTAAYMQSAGLPAILLWPTILFEILAGLALAVGYKTRLAAFALAGFSLLTAALFHSNLADEMQMILCLKNVAIAGGLLLLAVGENTAFSMDKRRSQNDFFGTRQERRK